MQFCQCGSIDTDFFGIMFYLIAWSQIFAITSCLQFFLREFFRDKWFRINRTKLKDLFKKEFYLQLSVVLTVITVICYAILFYLKLKC